MRRKYAKVRRSSSYKRPWDRERVLDGSLLLIRNSNDCITVSRNGQSQPHIESVEGKWTTEEMEQALNRYDRTEAARR